MDLYNKWLVFWEKFGPGGAWRQVVEEGLVNTLLIALIGLVIGIVIGTVISAIRVMPKYRFYARLLDKICSIYVGFFRGTPIVAQLLIANYVLFPMLEIVTEPLYICIAVFGLNSAAYVSEIMRGGIMSVDPGQMEAGRAVGLSYSTTLVKIVVPQAIKNIIPTLGNELIALLKDTSVVSMIAAVDLSKTFTIIGNSSYEYLIPYSVMALMYIVMVALVSLIVKILERSLRKSDRRN